MEYSLYVRYWALYFALSSLIFTLTICDMFHSPAFQDFYIVLYIIVYDSRSDPKGL